MMIYIDSKPNPSGAYANPKMQPFANCIPLTDEQAQVFFEYNGFVSITQTDDDITVVPNVEAWEAWKASIPDNPTQPAEDDTLSVYDELANAYREGVQSAYD